MRIKIADNQVQPLADIAEAKGQNLSQYVRAMIDIELKRTASSQPTGSIDDKTKHQTR